MECEAREDYYRTQRDLQKFIAQQTSEKESLIQENKALLDQRNALANENNALADEIKALTDKLNRLQKSLESQGLNLADM